MGSDKNRIEALCLLIGGVGVPVVASLLIPALPENARVPVGIGVGSLVLVLTAFLVISMLRRDIRSAATSILASLEGYNVDEVSGQLFKGTIRNASLRITTIHDVVDTILQAVSAQERDRVLYEAGYKTGTSWGPEFSAECRRAGLTIEDLPEKLKRWADYDASAGMGRLDLDIAGNGFGSVVLRNSFLSDQRACHALNHWFAGYIAGTLYHIIDQPVRVTLDAPSLERQRETRFTVVPAHAAHLSTTSL